MKRALIILSGSIFLMMSCSDQADFKGGTPVKAGVKASDAQPDEDPLPPSLEVTKDPEPAVAPEVIITEERELVPPPLPPVEEELAPLTLDVVLPANEIKAGKSIQAKAIPSRKTDSTVIWSVEESQDGADVGSIDSNGLYTGPAAVNSEITVTITATLADDPSVKDSQQLKIIPASTLFVGCKRGNSVFPITAEVYSIPENSTKLPNYDQIADRKQTTVCMDKYDVPTRDFTAGFPEIPNLFEWFSLHTKTKIVIPVAGNYKFRVFSDDGANLYIDGKKVVDNDGTHSPRERDGAVNLTAGEHELVLDYYQGPRTQIALQLYWATPANSNFVVVPTEAFKP